MSWPTNKANTTYTDSDTDLISLARPDLNQNIINVNGILDYYDTTGPYDTAGEYTKQQWFDLQTLTDGATVNWDLNTAQVAKLVLGGNRTIDMSNPKPGATYILFVYQDGTGSRSLTFGSSAASFRFPGGGSPALSTAPNSVDIITFISDGTALFGTIAKGYV